MDNKEFLRDYNEVVLPRLEEIIEPLKLIGVSSYEYIKIFDDKKIFRVCTHKKFNKLFFEHNLHNNFNPNRWPIATGNEVEFNYRLWHSSSGQSNDDYRLAAGMGQGITIYRTTKDYKEGWAFGGKIDDSNLPTFYLNNLDLLLKFIVYFKTIASDILDASDKRKLLDIEFSATKSPVEEAREERVVKVERMLEMSRYLVESPKGKFWLSTREVACLRYKNQGLSAKETAQKLDLSYRTIQSYLENIQSKSPMSNISQTINICKQQGLI